MNEPKLERCPMTHDVLIGRLEYFANGCYTTPESKDDLLRESLAHLRRAQPDNPPLTVEELRGMNGEPVWIVAHPDWGHWELSERAEDYFEDRDEDFYGMTMPPTLLDPMGRYGLHMLGWLAYRRPQEKGEHHEV